MQLTLVDKMTLGGAVPLANTAVVALDGAAAASLPRVTALAAGAARATARVTVSLPSIQARIDALAAIAARLVANPTISVSAAGVADVAASLVAELESLQAYAALALDLSATLGAAGVYAYTIEGEIGDLNEEVSEKLGGGLPDVGDPNQQVYGVLLLAGEPAAITALREAFAS